MMRAISRHKRIFGYIFYGILLLVVLLYFRFPSGAFSAYLQAKADEISPRYHVLVGKVRPSLPFGVKFLRTKVSLRGYPDKIPFFSESLRIKPEIISLVKGKSKYEFDCFAYRGEIKGYVHFTNNRMDGPFTTSIGLQYVHLHDYGYLSTLIGRDVKGILGGTITYSGQSKLLINGVGEANLGIADGRVEILQPILGLNSVDFDELRIKMFLDKQKINVASVELEGPDLRGTLSGTISLNKDFSESTLALKGSIEPLAGLFTSDKGDTEALQFLRRRLKRGKLSFVIRGTPAEPKIRFI